MSMSSLFGKTQLRRKRLGQSQKGFTLIELLIVIAIILILIAIALPNFLEAQIRARVTKAKGEIKSISTAMLSYYNDWKIYPVESEANWANRLDIELGLKRLTTPIKYITSIPTDAFEGDESQPIYYELGGVEKRDPGSNLLVAWGLETWALYSRGPDAPAEEILSASPNYLQPADGVHTYSPTNGTKSRGDIFQYGGDPYFIGIQIDQADRALAKTRPAIGLMVDGTVYLHRLPPGVY